MLACVVGKDAGDIRLKAANSLIRFAGRIGTRVVTQRPGSGFSGIVQVGFRTRTSEQNASARRVYALRACAFQFPGSKDRGREADRINALPSGSSLHESPAFPWQGRFFRAPSCAALRPGFRSYFHSARSRKDRISRQPCQKQRSNLEAPP